MRFALPTKLAVTRVTAPENRFHGSSAAYVKIGYGTPSDGILAIAPNTAVKITIVVRGWRMAHEAPRAV